MDPRILFFTALGIGLVAAARIERLLERTPVTMPLVYLALGWLLFELPLGLPPFYVAGDAQIAVATEYLTEFIVIVSLMGAGIAIDRPLSWRNWRQIWPLLAILMPVTIGLVAALGHWFLGLAPAAAVLLGAALAPTDPVLARSVQVGPPGEDARHDVRFGLTVEAGLNDGLAFPFTYLAIAAVGMTSLGDWTWRWLWLDVLWRTAAGVAVGAAVGAAGAWLVFHRTDESRERGHERSEGLVVLGTLLSSYGLAEVVEGYGFLSVFTAAVTTRQFERRGHYHKVSHHFIDQVERIVLVAMMLALGGVLAGGVLDALTWRGALVGLALVFVIRPGVGMLAQLGARLPWTGRFAVAFLGIRGMGTLYYLAYGQNHGDFSGDLSSLWAVATFTIVVSIVVHGLAAARMIAWLESHDGHVTPGEAERVG